MASEHFLPASHPNGLGLREELPEFAPKSALQKFGFERWSAHFAMVLGYLMGYFLRLAQNWLVIGLEPSCNCSGLESPLVGSQPCKDVFAGVTILELVEEA